MLHARTRAGKSIKLHKITLSVKVLLFHPLPYNKGRIVYIFGPRLYKVSIYYLGKAAYLKNDYKSVIFCINIILICHIVWDMTAILACDNNHISQKIY